MSYSHTQRRKTIKRFKKAYGKEWYKHFRSYVAEEQHRKAFGALKVML